MHEHIREHMKIIGADGVHVGTVDKVEGSRIKMTKMDSGGAGFGGGHQDHHHYIPLGLVAAVDDQVRLSANADVAVTFEEEREGDQIEDDRGARRSGSDVQATMTGGAPQQTNASVTDMIDESGRSTS